MLGVVGGGRQGSRGARSWRREAKGRGRRAEGTTVGSRGGGGSDVEEEKGKEDEGKGEGTVV